MAQLLLDGVSKHFRAADDNCIDALRNISLSIDRGELLVLLGPSGSGKTTLLRILAGLERADEGKVVIDGKDAASIPPERRDLAMVFQNGALHPHLTARENISLGLKLRKLSRHEIEARVTAIADRLGLQILLDRLPRELSGGERQRVALARALVRQPRILLLDEPLSHADAPRRVQLRRELAELHAELGTTVIHVTHDQEEALALGDRVAVLREGTLQQVGTPRDLYDRPANVFVAGFLGPGMNLLRGMLLNDEKGCFLCLNLKPGNEPGNSMLPLAGQLREEWKSHCGREVLLGVRPEKIRLEQSPSPHFFPVPVQRVENIGAAARVFLHAAHQPVVALVPGRLDPAPLFGRIHIDDCRLFDVTTGRTLD